MVSGVVVAATGVALASGAVTQHDAPADTSVTAATVDPAETGPTNAAEAPLTERRNVASRSGSRTSLDSADRRTSPDSDSGPAKKRPADADPRAVARKMLPEFGFAASEFGCLDALYVSESDWDMHADNPSSSAYGIPQALMSAHDLPADYTTNPATQIRWGLGYIRDSYGTPCAAWEFKQSNDFY